MTASRRTLKKINALQANDGPTRNDRRATDGEDASALIADRLGVDQETFKAWAARLDAHKDYIEPDLSFDDFLRKLRRNRGDRSDR